MGLHPWPLRSSCVRWPRGQSRRYGCVEIVLDAILQFGRHRRFERDEEQTGVEYRSAEFDRTSRMTFERSSEPVLDGFSSGLQKDLRWFERRRRPTESIRSPSEHRTVSATNE